MASLKGGSKLGIKLLEIADGLGDNARVRVGFLEGATYPAGGYKSLTTKQLGKVLSGGNVRRAAAPSGGQPVAMIAAFNEFGTGKSPPRPFFRNMIAAKQAEWPKGIAVQLKETNYNVARTLDRTGMAIAGQLRQSIVDTNSPALSPRTIARKGFSKPLVDTGHMLQSVDHEVKA